MRNLIVLLVLSVACLSSCEKHEQKLQGETPPPLPVVKSGACEGSEIKLSDAETARFFRGKIAGYCLDPNGDATAYGKDAPRTLDHLCVELLDGECDVYRSFGLERTVALRYIDGGGSPASVSIYLSRFATSEQALSFYTERVVGEGDPLRVAPKPLSAGTLGALGSGIAYVWAGTYVVELSYTNELESPDQLRSSATKILPLIAKEVGHDIGASTAPPSAVRALPEGDRVESGLRYVLRDVLEVKGTGAAACGYYKRGDRRFRVLAFARGDEEAVEDLVSTFGKARGFKKLKDAPPVLRSPFEFVATGNGVKSEWLFAARGTELFGVGDEPLVMTESMTNPERAALSLSREEKLAELLKLVHAGQDAK